jgi:hypothetical protein
VGWIYVNAALSNLPVTMQNLFMKIFFFSFRCRVAAAALFSLCSSAALAQYTIQGIIVDEKGKKVDVGNVILLDTDSTFRMGEMFMDGKFEIKSAAQDRYILKITALSCNDHYQQIDNSSHQPVLNVGTIKMIPKELGTVEVIGRTPLLKNEGDRMIVDVENSLLKQSGTALDVLEGSPGVMVTGESNVSVFGKGDAVIYIDGQLATPDMLKAIPSNQVKKVEIITKPSAMYDAQGKVVINVITNKVILNGYQSELFLQQTYGKYYYAFGGGNFNYRKNKVSLFARYSLFSGNRWGLQHYERAFVTGADSVKMFNDIDEKRSIKGAHYYGLGARYALDSLSSLGVMWSGNYALVNKHTNNTNALMAGGVDDEITTFTEGRARTLDNNLNMNYNHKFDTLGTIFSVQASYSRHDVNSLSYIDESIMDSSGAYSSQKRNTGLNSINIITAQADHVKAFYSKWKLESGIKFSDIFNGSSVRFDRLTGTGEWIGDETVSNGFDYDEKVGAVYLQAGRTKDKWNYRAGLRSELTDTHGLSKRANETVADTTYIDIFPSAFAQYSFTGKLAANADYSYRIDRPKYQDLDPFINYIDSLSSIRGNPFLRPEYTHHVSVALVYMEAASIELGYSHAKDVMNTYVQKLEENSNAFYGQTRNLNSSEGYSAELTLPYENKWYTTYNVVGWSKNTFSYDGNGSFVVNAASSWYAYTYHKFNIKSFTVDAMFHCYSGGVDGIFSADPSYALRASAEYSMLDKKLTFRFVASDILNSSKESGTSRIPGFDLKFRELSDSHYFRFAINYKFGKLSQKGIEEQNINNEERNRIK